jgi:hypothetical protein
MAEEENKVILLVATLKGFLDGTSVANGCSAAPTARLLKLPENLDGFE